jgi:glycerophosphoryl diester phosphodiesterase
MLVPITVPDRFRIIAHRGASAYAPENTRAAFRLARDMGVTEFELDAQLTTDGVVVLCHDATLARYGHGGLVVEQMAWADLASLDMGSWFSPHLYRGERMLTLDALFAEHRDAATYHVELKGKGRPLPAGVYDVIRHHGLQANCIITSFSYGMLLAMGALDGDLRLGWLVGDVNAEVLALAADARLYQVCPDAKVVTPETVTLARSVAQEVRAWGLSGAQHEVVALIEKVVAAGCDGMTINWPDWVRHEGNRS